VRLILVRHALPHRVSAGSSAADPELTELGHQQAHRVADAVAREGVTAVYTSPQLRARQTAAPLAQLLGVAPTVAAGLAEFDSNDASYVPVHEMAEASPALWQRLRAGQLPAHVDAPAFGARVSEAFAAISRAHPGARTVACFAHAGTINVYLAGVLGMDRPLAFPLDYTGITRVSVSRGGRRVARTVNEIAHVADLLDPATTPAPPGGPRPGRPP
jgi:probable phosphoglycerate mutase